MGNSEPRAARAFAKLNLSLLVRARDGSGLHPIRSLAQSVDWADRLVLAEADEDALEVDDDLGDPADNLAWRALEAVRGVASDRRPVRLSLEKRIPVAAGLGGGSADAAAALGLAGALLGVEGEVLAHLATELGADVPFCLTGGTALVEGAGELITPLPPLEDLWVAVAVPPFRLDTAAVYRRWDEMEGPAGEEVAARYLPPHLRQKGEPIRNDLFPAAVSMEPRLGDWQAAVAREWGRPALMTGSGPALFGLFPTSSEAADAAQAIPGTRAARGCRNVDRGWEREPTDR